MMLKFEVWKPHLSRFRGRLLRAHERGGGALCAAVLMLAVLAATQGRASGGADPLGALILAREVGQAAEALETRVDALPREAQVAIGAEVRLLVHAMRGVQAGVARQEAPLTALEVRDRLAFVADVGEAVGVELDRWQRQRANSRAEAEIHRLAQAARGHLAALGQALERTAASAQAGVLSVSESDGAVVVRSIDRELYEGTRLAALGLLLVGLLVIGMRLTALSDTETSRIELIRQAPLLAGGGLLAVVLSMAGAGAIAANPALLASVAERARVLPEPHACEALAAQRETLLLEARTLGNDALLERVKSRMRPAAQACFGLDSQVAAVEAVEWLAANLDAAESPAEASGMPDLAQLRAGTTPGGPAAVAQPAPAPAPPAAVEPGVRAAEPAVASGGPEEVVPAVVEAPTAPLPAPRPALRTRQVVTTARVNYRAGPGTGEPRLGTLAEGVEAILLREEAGWSNIQLQDGRSVYVASDYLAGPS